MSAQDRHPIAIDLPLEPPPDHPATGQLPSPLAISQAEPLAVAAPAPVPAPPPASNQPTGIAGWLPDALDGSVVSIPVAFVGVALAYAALPAQYLSAGILATLLALALVHAMSATTGRPIVFSARLLEGTTLASIVLGFKTSAVAWGLPLTDARWLALLCLVSGGAALVCVVLSFLRADRFTRLIPSPVYAGFAISISLLLLVSQSQTFVRLWQQGASIASLAVIGIVAAGTALAVRKLAPRWPSTACGIAAGAVAATLWQASTGQTVATVMSAGETFVLPWQLADFVGVWEQTAKRDLMLRSVAGHSVLLGTMVFINHTVGSETISQLDDRYATRAQQVRVAMATALGGLAGSAPLSASPQAATAASRNTPNDSRKCWVVAACCVLCAVLGVLNWVALAAIAAVMLVDAWYLADRPALQQAALWLRRKPMSNEQKEDLALVVAVALCAVFFNVVYAVVVGLLLGLVMFGMRNARQPVRHIWSGAQLHSNCARGRKELATLSTHGASIKVVELDANLFFASVASLERSLQTVLAGASVVVLDGSRVRHIDSSVALPLQRWVRAAQTAQVQVLFAGAGLSEGNSPAFVARNLAAITQHPDLDRALEAAESAVIARHVGSSTQEATQLHEALQLFHGLSAQQRQVLEQEMPQRLFKPGDTLFEAGDASDHMLIVLHGHAEILMPKADGGTTRLTSVRRGGVVGEIGFLDGAPRSARVVAQDAVLAAVLTRSAFDRMKAEQPQIMTQMLANLTIDLAARLRHTNKLASARAAAA